MNDFIAKPLNPDVLYKTLLKWLPTPPSHSPESATSPVPEADEWRRRVAGIQGLNIDRGLTLVRNNQPLYARLLAMFIDTHAGDVNNLTEKIAANDLASVRKLAHVLKGSAGNLGAIRVSDEARLLLSAIRQSAAPEEITDCCTALSADLASLIDDLRIAL